jgi:hypothetical protein
MVVTNRAGSNDAQPNACIQPMQSWDISISVRPNGILSMFPYTVTSSHVHLFVNDTA